MPSFDVVSEVDMHEAHNAVDQANREVGNRFDFKGTESRFEQDDVVITLHSQTDFQLKQMLDIVQDKLTRRGIDIACLKIDDPEITGRQARQRITLRHGLDAPLAKKIVQAIKQSNLKVQASIMGDRVRVSGKKKDDLQKVMALLRETDSELPLQYINFRD
jgi:cyclic-di-GMP-binding protein